MTMTETNVVGVDTNAVLDLAAQLSNDGSQPSQQGTEQQEQRVPYDRFKEVNDERKTLQEQNTKLMEMMQQFQTMQQPQQQQVQQPTQPVAQPLFTEEELNSFEQDIVLDPKATLQKFGEAILNRGVTAKVSALEQSFEQKLAQLSGQMVAQTVPTVIAQFKQARFSPSQVAEIAAFDQVVQGIDPALLTNPMMLENVRLAAIGYVADQKQAQQPRPQAFFSETPGGAGLPGGFGGLGLQANNPQVPAQVMEVARRLGVDPTETANMYTAMNQSGVFR